MPAPFSAKFSAIGKNKLLFEIAEDLEAALTTKNGLEELFVAFQLGVVGFGDEEFARASFC